MSGNNYYTVEELAAKLDTSYRSIYRYIDTFKEVGFAIEKINGNIYRILKTDSHLKALNNLVFFSEEEAQVLANLIENLDQTHAMKAGLYKKLATVYDISSIKQYSGPKCNSANIQALGDAIRDKRKVVLKNYSSAHSGVIRDRLVEPFGFTNNHIDVWAYDIENKENRLFKIPRIEWVDILFEPWVYEDKHEKGHIDAFRMMSFGEQTHVRLEMTLRAKNLLVEEFPLAEPDVKQENGKWYFDSMVSKMEGVGRFVIGLAADIKVIDCPELAKYVNDYYQQYVSQI